MFVYGRDIAPSFSSGSLFVKVPCGSDFGGKSGSNCVNPVEYNIEEASSKVDLFPTMVQVVKGSDCGDYPITSGAANEKSHNYLGVVQSGGLSSPVKKTVVGQNRIEGLKEGHGKKVGHIGSHLEHISVNMNLVSPYEAGKSSVLEWVNFIGDNSQWRRVGSKSRVTEINYAPAILIFNYFNILNEDGLRLDNQSERAFQIMMGKQKETSFYSSLGGFRD